MCHESEASRGSSPGQEHPQTRRHGSTATDVPGSAGPTQLTRTKENAHLHTNVKQKIPDKNVSKPGGFPGVLGLRLCTPNAGGPGLIPGQGTRYHKL